MTGSPPSKYSTYLRAFEPIETSEYQQILKTIRVCLLEFAARYSSSVPRPLTCGLIGSNVFGLTTKSSDLDIAIFLDEENPLSNTKRRQLLDTIRDYMKQEYRAKMIQLFVRGRSALLTVDIPGLHRQVDVSLALTKDAMINSALFAEYLVRPDTRALDLVKVVKLWAKRRKLNDSSNGQISTYSLTVIVIHYLQQLSPPVLPVLQTSVGPEFRKNVRFVSENTQTLDELVTGFFTFFSTFPWSTDAISITTTPRPARHGPKSIILPGPEGEVVAINGGEGREGPPMMVVDPVTVGSNAGRTQRQGGFPELMKEAEAARIASKGRPGALFKDTAKKEAKAADQRVPGATNRRPGLRVAGTGKRVRSRRRVVNDTAPQGNVEKTGK